MAMSNCKECGKEVSTLAKTCPNCGVSKPANKIKESNKINKQEIARELSIFEVNENIKDSRYRPAIEEAVEEYKKALTKGEIQIGDHYYNRKEYLNFLREAEKNFKKFDSIKFKNLKLEHFTPHWDTISRFPTKNEEIIRCFFEDRKLDVLEGIWQEEDWGVLAIVKEGNKFQRYAIDINYEHYEESMKKYITFEKLNGTKDGAFLKTSQKNIYKSINRICWTTNPEAKSLGDQMVFSTSESTLKIINENKLLEKRPEHSHLKKSAIFARIWPKRLKEHNKEIPINKSSNESDKREENLRSTTTSESTNKNEFEKFLDGQLDLATSFWGFLIVGTLIVGFICGFLAGAFGKFFVIPLAIYTWLAVQGTWGSAEKYKIEKNKKKQSIVWGILAQVVCALNVISMIGVLYDTFVK